MSNNKSKSNKSRRIVSEHREWCAFCGATAYGGVCGADSSHYTRGRHLPGR